MTKKKKHSKTRKDLLEGGEKGDGCVFGGGRANKLREMGGAEPTTSLERSGKGVLQSCVVGGEVVGGRRWIVGNGSGTLTPNLRSGQRLLANTGVKGCPLSRESNQGKKLKGESSTQDFLKRLFMLPSCGKADLKGEEEPLFHILLSKRRKQVRNKYV